MDLSKLIEQSLETKSSEAPREYIGASSIGNDCNRAIWYSAKGYISSSVSARLKRTFDLGKLIESMLLEYLDYIPELKIIRPNTVNNQLACADNMMPYFSGHIDALIVAYGEEIILEIKSAKDDSFKKFIKDDLKQWSSHYYAQIQAYMGMYNKNKAIILVFNKDTSQLHHELVYADDLYYCELQQKARTIWEAVEPPERINKNPSFYKCVNCLYKETCHASGT